MARKKRLYEHRGRSLLALLALPALGTLAGKGDGHD
jgi:hypothetical protein